MIKGAINRKKENRFGNFKRTLSPIFTNYQLKTTKSGFTFIELIIVVTVIGILSTLFIAQYPATQRRARDAQRRSDIKQYQAAMESYANSNNGNYYEKTNAPLANQCTTLGLSNCPDDPNMTSWRYRMYSNISLYVLYARLEQPKTPRTWFAVCSNGTSGETTIKPNSADWSF